MKRFGFRAAFAGGVEATSSMGGQIMPPVMGAVAFIMAETLNVPYAEVVKAALIPALLYFGACFWMVYIESGKFGLAGMSRAELPNPWHAIRDHWPLILPLGVLVYLLFAGYTPIFAGTMGLALTVVLILGMPLAALIGPFAFRLVFWVALGLAAAAFLRWGVNVLMLVLGALVAACALFHGGRATLRICLDSLAEGAKNAVPVGIACAIVGIVIGTLTLTGIASTFIGAIIAIGENNLFLSLFLTMVTCLILGMGIPTIPNYIITSSIAGPALLALDVPLLVSHMFVFYFGIMADLTPPVALAAFAAAPMARVSGTSIAVQATKLAVAGYVVPFMAVFTPSLMLQDGGAIAATFGYPVEVAYVFLKACLGIALFGAAVVGFLLGPHAALGARPRRRGGDPARPRRALDRRGRLRAGRRRRRAALVAAAARGGMSLCLAGAETLRLAVTAFTLAWTHSVEHLRWEEDWRVTPAGLELVEARVQGSGAGMEPPEGARLAGGWWTWRPARPPQRRGPARRLGRHRRRLDPLRRRSLPRDRRRGGRAAAAVRLRLSAQSRARSAVSSARRPAISAAALDRWAISGAVRPLSIARE